MQYNTTPPNFEASQKASNVFFDLHCVDQSFSDGSHREAKLILLCKKTLYLLNDLKGYDPIICGISSRSKEILNIWPQQMVHTLSSKKKVNNPGNQCPPLSIDGTD